MLVKFNLKMRRSHIWEKEVLNTWKSYTWTGELSLSLQKKILTKQNIIYENLSRVFSVQGSRFWEK